MDFSREYDSSTGEDAQGAPKYRKPSSALQWHLEVCRHIAGEGGTIVLLLAFLFGVMEIGPQIANDPVFVGFVRLLLGCICFYWFFKVSWDFRGLISEICDVLFEPITDTTATETGFVKKVLTAFENSAAAHIVGCAFAAFAGFLSMATIQLVEHRLGFDGVAPVGNANGKPRIVWAIEWTGRVVIWSMVVACFGAGIIRIVRRTGHRA